ncbi:hypothetical protein GSU68_08870 [Rathayibacter sp. VKM Ac-2759]|nr:hypothetical protein GSU68_08870 [Rathayibacter sp. VKM Ac-2759]
MSRAEPAPSVTGFVSRRPVASVHVRAVVTWLAIFPLVTIGMTVLALVADQWPPVLRAFVLTAVVVPLAVYQIVPRLLGLHGRIVAFRGRRRAARG